MSGGRWQYARWQYDLRSVGEDASVQKRWPLVSSAFVDLANALAEVEHDMDWCLSGDTVIEDDAAFDAAAYHAIASALGIDAAVDGVEKQVRSLAESLEVLNMIRGAKKP